MDIESKSLRVLVAILDHESFTEAAIELGMTQASVSRALARLEAQLGTELVHRTTRRVHASDAGAAFANEARAILANLDRAIADARGDRSIARIGYTWAALGQRTTEILRSWAKTHPELALRMVRINRRDAGLAEGLCDLAVVRGPVQRRDVSTVLVTREKRVLVVPVDHRLARSASVTLADIAPEVVAMDRHTGTTTGQLWADEGLNAPEVVDTNDVEEWLDLIAANEAVGVTAKATEHYYPRPGVVFVPISDAPLLDVSIAWNRNHAHPATNKIVKHILDSYRTVRLA